LQGSERADGYARRERRDADRLADARWGPPRRPEMEDHVAESYNGYCVKCKEKRDFDGEVKVSESGRRMAQGPCPVCGTKMNRILGKA
jgi:hypothetical protein